MSRTPAHVVHGTLHGGAYIDDDYGGHVAIDPHCLVQVIVVHLAAVLAFDHDVARVEQTHYLHDAVVSILGIVDDAVGEQGARQVQAVHVALVPPEVT